MIADRADLKRYLLEDLSAHNIDHWRPHFIVSNRIVYFQRILRHDEYWHNRPGDGFIVRLMRTFYSLLHVMVGERLGFSIPRNCFGPGLSIAHKGTIVVNMYARIGSRCRIHQGVTIGEANGRYPVIGDDVHIGPNVVVIGASIGDGAGLWAGSVVTHDVPPGTSVAGVPAKVVKVSER